MAAVRAAAGWEVVAKAVAAREVVVMGALVVAVALVESAGEGTRHSQVCPVQQGGEGSMGGLVQPNNMTT